MAPGGGGEEEELRHLGVPRVGGQVQGGPPVPAGQPRVRAVPHQHPHHAQLPAQRRGLQRRVPGLRAQLVDVDAGAGVGAGEQLLQLAVPAPPHALLEPVLQRGVEAGHVGRPRHRLGADLGLGDRGQQRQQPLLVDVVKSELKFMNCEWMNTPSNTEPSCGGSVPGAPVRGGGGGGGAGLGPHRHQGH